MNAPAEPLRTRLREAPPLLTRRKLLMGIALGSAAVAANVLKPREKMDVLGGRRLEAIIPKQVGAWTYLNASGLVIPPDDDLRDSIYSEVLTRTYIADGRSSIMLLIAASAAQDGTIQVHRPEYCYPAGGYSLRGERDYPLNLAPGRTVQARALTAYSADRIEQIVYWTRIGTEMPLSWAEQRLSVARQNFKGIIPDGVLVRVSTISNDAATLSEINSFIAALVAGSGPLVREALFGRTPI